MRNPIQLIMQRFNAEKRRLQPDSKPPYRRLLMIRNPLLILRHPQLRSSLDLKISTPEIPSGFRPVYATHPSPSFMQRPPYQIFIFDLYPRNKQSRLKEFNPSGGSCPVNAIGSLVTLTLRQPQSVVNQHLVSDTPNHVRAIASYSLFNTRSNMISNSSFI